MTTPEATSTLTTAKKPGRPRKADPPRIAYHELDRLLVFGEVVDAGDGHGPATQFPSYRDLAKRYGVSHSVIANYSARHDCLRRREGARQRVDARTDEKLVEQRATELAAGKVRALETIDAFISSFAQALRDGRVRVDSVADFNLMLRLKEFLQGGPDSRHEVNATISLSELQRRHSEMLRRHAEEGGAPALTGAMPPRESGIGQDDEQHPPENSPALPSERAHRKANGQFAQADVALLDERPPDAANTAASS